jgi:hypothetical protein
MEKAHNPSMEADSDGDGHETSQNQRQTSLRRRVLSPFHGLRFFCDALIADEENIAAAYDEVASQLF